MGDLISLFLTGGGITTLLSLLGKLYGMSKEESRLNLEMMRAQSKAYREMQESIAKREAGNPWLLAGGVISRAFMLVVSMGMLCFMSVYGAINPDVPIYFPEEAGSYSLRIFGFFEVFSFTGKDTITWRQFNGIVIYPIWMIIIGAQIGYHLGAGIGTLMAGRR